MLYYLFKYLEETHQFTGASLFGYNLYVGSFVFPYVHLQKIFQNLTHLQLKNILLDRLQILTAHFLAWVKCFQIRKKLFLGESGIIVAPDGFLQEVRKLCDEKGILLIFDEIQAGLGRTGRLWAGEHWNTAPDILCLAKGIAGGVPMGATLVRPDILAAISKGEHSSTFGGNPISCAAGIAALTSITEIG